MKRVARHWAKSDPARTTRIDALGFAPQAWGASDRSEQAARAAAQERAEAIARRANGGDVALGWYAYVEKVRPEPIVEEMTGAGGVRVAAVTVSRAGVAVMNTTRLAFVDVDLEPPSRGRGLLGALFGRRATPVPAAPAALAALRQWVEAEPGRSARAYRTAAGLRYALLAPPMDPTSDATAAVMHELGADPLYARLCRAQESFRARLTPKPWRLPGRLACPTIRWGDDAALAAWNARYEPACAGHAVCELVADLGTAPASDETLELVATHDAWTKVGSGLPLA